MRVDMPLLSNEARELPESPRPFAAGDILVNSSTVSYLVLGEKHPNGNWRCQRLFDGEPVVINEECLARDFSNYKHTGLRFHDMARYATFEPVESCNFTFRGVRIRMLDSTLKVSCVYSPGEHVAVRCPDNVTQSAARDDWKPHRSKGTGASYFTKQYAYGDADYSQIRTADNIYADALNFAAYLAALAEDRDPCDLDYHGLPKVIRAPDIMPVERWYTRPRTAAAEGCVPATVVDASRLYIASASTAILSPF